MAAAYWLFAPSGARGREVPGACTDSNVRAGGALFMGGLCPSERQSGPSGDWRSVPKRLVHTRAVSILMIIALDWPIELSTDSPDGRAVSMSCISHLGGTHNTYHWVVYVSAGKQNTSQRVVF